MGEVSVYGLPGETGVLLVRVPGRSAAEKAGLKQDDVILKCQGRDIDSVADLLMIIKGPPRSILAMDVWRLQQRVSVNVPVE